MTGVECVQLIAYIRQRSPQTFLVDGTPDAWYPDLAPFDIDDGKEAVDALTRRPGNLQVSLGDLLTAIKSIRQRRLTDTFELAPDADPDDVPAYIAALRESRFRVAGAPNPERAKAVAALTAGRAVPKADYGQAARRARELLARAARERAAAKPPAEDPGDA